MRQRTQAILESSEGEPLSMSHSYRKRRDLDLAVDFFMWRYNGWPPQPSAPGCNTYCSFLPAPSAPDHVTLKQRQWPWYPENTVECRMKYNRGYTMLRKLYSKPLETSSCINTPPFPWTLGARKRKRVGNSESEETPAKRWRGMDDADDGPGQDEPLRRPRWLRGLTECPPVFD
jgi:hypothetical protein